MIKLYQNVLITVNSHHCYMWIVNKIIDCNSSLFSVSFFSSFFFFCSISE